MKNVGLKRENIRLYCYYSAVVVLSACVYYCLHNLNDSIVKALLDFYKTIVEIFFSNSHYYNENLGYYSGYAYNIGKDCLGLGIIALIFCCCGILSIKTFRGYMRILGVIASAPAAFISGVLANNLRLLSSIYFISFARFELIHALLGIVIYLSVLFLFYRIFNWLDEHSPGSAKSANNAIYTNNIQTAQDNIGIGNSGITEKTGNAGNAEDAGNSGNAEDARNTGNTGNTEDTGNTGDTGNAWDHSEGNDVSTDDMRAMDVRVEDMANG